MWFSAVLIALLAVGLHQLLSKPPPRRDEHGNIMDPVGGSRLKNFIGLLIAKIAKTRERRKWESAKNLEEIERFHYAEPHEFFNESHYYNGCDLNTKDRIITRMSRRGRCGKKTYMFLLIDSAEHGELALEKDDVPAETSKIDPSALGLTYTLVDPMNKWNITYKGKLRRKCATPAELKKDDSGELVDVEVELEYERDTPVFWYMRDDCAETLGNNLSQEPWGQDFVNTCLKRTKNHGHYEDYGSLKGHIIVDGKRQEYNFASFRDHSWDIRRWQTMDSLFIVLLALEKPLKLFGHEYKYLDLTLVSMPGNSSGVARYSTGYALPRKHDSEENGAPILSMTVGTSINDIPWKDLPDGRREPMPESEIVFYVRPEPPHPLAGASCLDIPIKIKMDGDIRRLKYYPDNHGFEVFEDMMNFTVSNGKTGHSVQGYGTRQSGFRVGTYDPTLGGCG